MPEAPPPAILAGRTIPCRASGLLAGGVLYPLRNRFEGSSIDNISRIILAPNVVERVAEAGDLDHLYILISACLECGLD